MTKSCLKCDRTRIAQHYAKRSPFWSFLSLPFIYLPILFLPVFLISGVMVATHLKLIGAKDLRPLRSFMPPRDSHRYDLKSQIVRNHENMFVFWVRSRIFWIFNCTFYCPISVGVLRWHTYLVMTVENWWCPFTHQFKSEYSQAAIDASYWHAVGDITQLHPDDHDNPIWNGEAKSVDSIHRVD